MSFLNFIPTLIYEIMFILSLGIIYIYISLFCYCRLETTRHVSMITITLSKKELNRSSVG